MAGFSGTMPLQTLFGVVAGILLATALMMFVVVMPIRRLMSPS